MITPDDAPVLSVTYHVASWPIPPGVPDLGTELPFVVSRIDRHDYRPARDSVHVTITPAWRAPTAEGEPAERCPHTDPGIPSVNHPERPTAPPWQCVHDAGHEGPHAPVRVCDKRPLVNGRPWPCVRALGHDGDCEPPVEARHLPKPLRECDREELISAASLAFAQAEIAGRDMRESVRRAREGLDAGGALAGYVLANSKSPHGNNHTADCWRRYAACLAFALIGSGGVLGGSIEDARALVERSR